MKILAFGSDRGGAVAVARSGRSRPDHAAHRPCRRPRHARSRRWRAPMSAASSSPRSATSCSTSTKSSTSCRSSRCRHETSADGKAVTIKLRPGVKFHDGEPFDAEAAKFSLERHLTMPGSFRKPELAARRPCRCRRSPDHQAGPQDAVLAADRPAHRPRRHDGLAQGGRRRKATSSACIRSAPAPTNSSSACQQDRIVFEKFADYWNKDNVFIDQIVYPADRRCHRAARQPEIRRPRPDRARAGDRHQGRARRPEAQAVDRDRARLSRPHASTSATTRPRAPLSQSAKVRQALDLSIDRDAHQPGRVQRRVHAGQPVGQSRSIPTIRRPSRFAKRDVAKAKALLKEAGVTAAASASTSWCRRAPRTEAVAAGHPVDGGRSRLRPEDPRHRVRDLAQAGRRPANSRSIMLGWSGRIDPDGNSYIFLHSKRAAERQRLFQSRSRQGAGRRAARHRSGAAQGDLREADQDRARRRADHLSLSPQAPDRAHHASSRATSRCRTGWCAWSG